ncbi:histidine kinase [Streptococcus iniae]|nr:histidine kinase [Streptococcus iniae]
MIRAFLKEYQSWYFTYISLILLYLLVFGLYHLPLLYIASLISMTLLLLISFWKYWCFKEKIKLLQEFIYVKELGDLQSPTELVYQAIIQKILSQHSDDLLNEKKKQQNMEAIIKLWTHQMKVPLAALSFMGQTGHIEELELQKQTYKIQNHINQLLSYMKFSQSNDDFRFEEIELNQVVKEILKDMRFLCISKNISVDLQGNWLLKSDKKWLTFALSQVIDNAIKYTRESGTIKIEIAQGSIKIQDSGIGILKEDLPRLFDEGFTGFNGHEHQKATGLGLFMTKEVLDKLNLQIAMTSQVDQGTEVLISKKER